jgi:predicted 3-demethylubiquinone-9 3-methyltransferase (glyoxalase superfamily)
MQKITPFLWFNDDAEEAAKFYVSIFKDSKIISIAPKPESVPGPGGVMVVKFQLNGMEFVALNGGPDHPFTDAISLMVNCETQEETDDYWKKLLAGGGTEVACGWLKDKYGVSWQVTPVVLIKLLEDKDKAKAERVMQAMMKMVKIDIAGIKKAAAG